MERLCGEERGKAAFRNAAKRTAARCNNTKLLEWIKTYRDMVAPSLPSTVTLPLEAALHAVEFANSSTPLGQTDWGAPARPAHDWWTGKKGGLVSPHILGAPDLIMRLANVDRSPSPTKVATQRRGNTEAKAIRESESTTTPSLFSPSPRDDNMPFIKGVLFPGWHHVGQVDHHPRSLVAVG